MGTIRARRWTDANTLGSFQEPPVYPEGFRWLQNHRAASLESGSPPGLGQLVRAERLQTYPVQFSPFKRPAFLSYSSSCPKIFNIA
jgi:hypothetical protein